jgi:hypothetical protein
MIDTERMIFLKRALELARLAESNVILTVDELQWLIEQAEKWFEHVANENTPPGEGGCLFSSLMDTGRLDLGYSWRPPYIDDANLSEEGE